MVHRRGHDGPEVLLVHRDRYDDWTYPKGKLDPGETWEQAAVREVFEETGIVAVLGAELPRTEYQDHRGRPKVVRYWLMAPAADVGFEPNPEITARCWLALEDARQRLTYRHDLAVLEAAGAVLGD